MSKYLVYYTMVGGNDYDKEWCYANSPEEAAETIKREHWDIESIDNVILLNN